MAGILGCSEKTVCELVRAGRLRPFRLTEHGRLRFRAADVEAFIESRRAAASRAAVERPTMERYEG